jgi:hypothetical protein
MKKFLFKSFVFIFILVVTFVTFEAYTDDKLYAINGPNTEQQIDLSFEYAVKEKYDLIALGNSRVYRGINPDKLSMKAFNFAHDNDCFNQAYYKLKYLERNNNLPKYLILGVDYFEFSYLLDTRNYAYRKYLGKEYLKDFNDDFNAYTNQMLMVKQNQFFLRLDNIKRVVNKDAKIPYLKENGQYIRYGKAKKRDYVERNSQMLDIQLKYFIDILDYCDQKDIEVFMVLLPLRENELKNYDNETLDAYNKFFNARTGEHVHFLDYSTSDKFTIEDFQDITHLNIEGADKFTKLLDEEIKKTS